MTDTTAPLVVALGEAMIRLTTSGLAPLSAASAFGANVAGAELNLLTATSQLGTCARWVTRLPDNDLGEMMVRHAQSFGIEVHAAFERGARAGVFFLEAGATPRPSRVLYDRRDSAFSHLSSEDFDWGEEVADASVAHVTGITCALGPGAATAVEAFLASARATGVATSLDVNFRSQLWGPAAAREGLSRAIKHADVVFAGPSDLALVLDDSGPTADLAARFLDSFAVSTLVVRERHEVGHDELGVVVRVFGADAADAEASGRVVDQLGAGDAAAGAFWASRLRGDDSATSARACARAYARALTLPGDAFVGTWHDLDEGFVTGRRLVR